MRFNRHSALSGLHAEFSASVYHWIRYDEQQVFEKMNKSRAAALGSRKHALAAELINLKVRLPNSEKTLSAYVNDCIGYKMKPEQMLFYSINFFGTADAIGFRRNRRPESMEQFPYILRVFDYKSGVSPTKVDQLMVYAALFCLEYIHSPFDMLFDLRIYQNNECRMYDDVTPEDIAHIMERIKWIDGLVEKRREEEEEI